MCAVDPFCCDVVWDQICANGAADLCNPLDCEDPAKCQAADLADAFLSNGVQLTAADNFVITAADEWAPNSEVTV